MYCYFLNVERKYRKIRMFKVLKKSQNIANYAEIIYFEKVHGSLKLKI